LRRIIIKGDDDQAAGAIHGESGMSAAWIVKVSHFSGVAAIEPFGKVLELAEITRRAMHWRDAAQIEADTAGLLADPGGFEGRVHTRMMLTGQWNMETAKSFLPLAFVAIGCYNARHGRLATNSGANTQGEKQPRRADEIA
jgi:hypothetical protein